MPYQGSLGYFFTRGLQLLNGWPAERLMLNGGGGSRVYDQLSLVLYPKHVHFASLMLTTKYWGFGQKMPLRKTITITWISTH
jgi:hypothetical protein